MATYWHTHTLTALNLHHSPVTSPDVCTAVSELSFNCLFKDLQLPFPGKRLQFAEAAASYCRSSPSLNGARSSSGWIGTDSR